MAVTSQSQTTFTAGEFSPKLLGRSDLRKYFDALSKCRNFLVEPWGGIVRRSGTRYVAATKYNSDETRLIPFQYSTTQSYVLEAGDLYVRFFRNRGQLLSAGSVYEIVSPYAGGQVRGVRFTQSADVLFTAHPEVRPKRLNRYGDVNWAFTDARFDDGPYQDQNEDRHHKLKPAATVGSEYSITAVNTGTKTFTIAGDHTAEVQAGDMLVAFDTTANDEQYTVVSDTLNAGNTDIVVNETVPDSTADGKLRFPVALSATKDTFAASDATSYRHVRLKQAGKWGWGKICRFVDAKHCYVTIFDNFTNTNTSPQWRLGAFADEDATHPVKSGGWPRVVALHGQRLWYASTGPQPQTIWGSVVGDFVSFQPDVPGSSAVTDDDGVTFTINDDQVNTIYWMVGGAKGMFIGTDGAEFVMTGGGDLQAITPTSVAVLRHTRHGSADGPRTVPVGPSTLFVAKGGRELRNFTFDFEADQFKAENLLKYSDHATACHGIRNAVLQKTPRPTVWVNFDDGQLWALTFDPSEQVVAWAPQPLAGTDADARSIATITDDPFDQLWLIASRTIGGMTKYYVEFLEDDFGHCDEQADAYFVDGGLSGVAEYEDVAAPPSYTEPDSYPGVLAVVMGQSSGANLAGTHPNIFTLMADDGAQINSATLGATAYDNIQGLSAFLTGAGAADIYVAKYGSFTTDPCLARYGLDLTQVWQITTIADVAFACAADATGVCVSTQLSIDPATDNYVINALCYNAAGVKQWGVNIGSFSDTYGGAVLFKTGNTNPIFATSNGSGVKIYELSRGAGATVSSSARFVTPNTCGHMVQGQLSDLYLVGDISCVRHNDSGVFANINTLTRTGTSSYIGLALRPYLGTLLNYVVDGGLSIGDTLVPIKQNVTGTGDITLGDFVRFAGHTTDYKVVGSTGLTGTAGAMTATLTVSPALTATVADAGSVTLVPTVLIGAGTATDDKILLHYSYDLANVIQTWNRTVLGLANLRSITLDVLRNVYIGGNAAAATANYRVKRITDVTGRIDDLFTTPYTLTSEPAEPWKMQWLNDPAYVAPTPTVPDTSVGKVVSNLDHLEGETVQILADGAVVPDQVVTGGQVSLPVGVTGSIVHAGLGYSSIATTMPLVLGRSPVDSRGKRLSAYRAWLRFNRSLGGSVGRDEDHTDVIPSRSFGDDMNEPPTLFTGLREHEMNGEYMRDVYVCVRQDQPLPMELLSMIVGVDFGGE